MPLVQVSAASDPADIEDFESGLYAFGADNPFINIVGFQQLS